ncbi:flagellar basal body rod protein FlgB [Tepidibacter hydrothermalis]|uniref:Flagellar basal body rod protein FlgB n=1 Tax=Tepidibacter hydrothermalis TaxID=3036126 RepID=A0ABY8EFW3_9FIRM|nr:flagellar basal body rod protein FlgB [Tepidibacter hydrothermalis]WFD11671.1 flagellar basal body rod protein FlgB [Tepidibacter hydrothermalis]
MRLNDNINLLSKSLDAYSIRQNAINNNISNSNTPNYKRKDVEFDKILRKITNENGINIKTTNPKHIGTDIDKLDLKPKIIIDKNTKSRLDGNNVDIDVEMAELSKNYIKYNVASQQITSAFKRYKNAISGGGR